MTEIQSSDLPLTVNNWTLNRSDLPSELSLPVDPHEIDWTGSLPSDDAVNKATLKTLKGATENDKANWMSDAIRQALRVNRNVPPGPDEAKQMLLKKAERDWGYDPMQLNRIKRDYPILFDYISAEKYESAKKFLKRMHTEEGVIEYHELQWVLDMLEGRKSIELS